MNIMRDTTRDEKYNCILSSQTIVELIMAGVNTCVSTPEDRLSAVVTPGSS